MKNTQILGINLWKSNGSCDSFSRYGISDDWLAAFMMSSVLLNPQLIIYSAALGATALSVRIVSCFLCGIAAGLLVRFKSAESSTPSRKYRAVALIFLPRFFRKRSRILGVGDQKLFDLPDLCYGICIRDRAGSKPAGLVKRNGFSFNLKV